MPEGEKNSQFQAYLPGPFLDVLGERVHLVLTHLPEQEQEAPAAPLTASHPPGRCSPASVGKDFKLKGKQGLR